ncbi:MAG: alpha/beta hydrolase-fold protein [Bacteroidota bacterium]
MTRETTSLAIIDEHYAVEHLSLFSEFLDRAILIDVYLPKNVREPESLPLLLVNDGQDLPKMPFASILSELVQNDEIDPVLAVGIYCNEDRRLEYGTADEPDYLNRGSRAKFHRKFVIKELIPYIRLNYHLPPIKNTAFAGFSLGGLSALDIVWKHPEIFNTAAVFSGSFWWRSRALDHGYNEDTDRIMHKLIRNGKFAPNLSFFLQAGQLDERMDRNNNGIIDSIDDTLDIIKELKLKGYESGDQIRYFEMPEGRHDVPTWANAFPEFLKWRYGK